MKKPEKYYVVCHKFLGYGKDGSAKYEIKFNKSLEHTGRFAGIADGLNAYDQKERKQEFKNSIPNVWRSFFRWVKTF